MPLDTATARRPSVWLDEPASAGAPLTADARCDVCVIGAGIAGLLTAENLAGLGMKVIVIDQGSVACGESGYTTAHFTTALDDRYLTLERLHGADGARLAAESHAAAIDYVESLAQRCDAACGWQRLPGYLVVNEHHAAEREELLEEERAAAVRAGLSPERVAGLPAPWPAALGPALRFPNQAQLHPVRLLRQVAARLCKMGAVVHDGTRAVSVHGGPDATVETEAGPAVRCAHIVVATNTPINNLVAVHTKQAGYQTYVIALRIPPGSLPPILLWDGAWKDDASYHYLRLLPGGEPGHGPDAPHDLLIVGGEDHKTGQGPDGDTPLRCLEEWARSHFPMCGPVVRRWSGEVMEPADGIGFIGHNATGRQNVYIVTGDSGNGMTHGAIAAMLIPDLIAARHNPWASLYDPARKVGLRGLPGFARENANTLAQYGDWLRRGDVRDESEIPPGQGAVIVRGLKHIAVYKDEHGACTRLNAMCTHLGGVVRWNELEKTWDCPCHASRFERGGKVMHGPANSDLRPEP
ncbi:MAG: FAD-dependent oxidoreductase [Phycisphaerales bacterium]|nr:FAD-dependent oxidoreductase [Phycisphaerales bacterium]